MKLKSLLTFIMGVGAFTLVNAQCPPQIICPANIIVGNDSGTCGAIVNYAPVVGYDTCTAGTRIFTNCGVTGRFGPTQTQVNTAYSSTSLNGEVTIQTQGYQEWGVPVSGVYTIEVMGAEGGSAAQRPPGKGAYIKGDFNLTAGDTLIVLVGQQGSPISSGGGGGGGGSFVMNKLTNDSLAVAGGGAGGNNHTASGYNFSDGGDTVNTGTHGGAVGYNSVIGGGGGLIGNGQGTNGGMSFVNGGVGGTGPGEGGFGGGGGKGGSTLNGGCGGGGYNGGAGNNNTIIYGGGGSFNAGTNQLNVADSISGHGKVIISWTKQPVPTTLVSGVGSGAFFPVGTTTETYVATNGSLTDTCSFTVTVIDSGQATVLAPFTSDTICTSSPVVTLPSGNPAGGTYSGTGVSGTTFDPSISGTGTFWVYYTDTVGCQNTDSTAITVEICAGVSQASFKDEVIISPNPGHGVYTVTMMENIEQSYVEIYTLRGRKISEERLTTKVNVIDITNQPDGVYLMKLTRSGESMTVRLIKE